MANKRDLKRKINHMIYDVVDECYSIQLYDGSKKEITDKFIDDAADFQEEIMGLIKRAKSKADYKAIVNKYESVNKDWTKRLNDLV
ncbi:MAG: hypothetical protein WC994_01740 [Brumimicrobium sp.]